MLCTTCNFKNTSQPEKVRAGCQKKSIFRIIDRRGLGASYKSNCIRRL
ncbi:hypothetical protein E2C01_080197 [Portunus trituberculatus]|uniref:Uncharacterized protein n=1 Tax=Portunus trituberculatus TaxID=210409 RepID=A0A5B7IST0_PORTR|nr:hypothetical protein [Portunus trituberculatus]